eukprot:3758703-Ditylum_brightwellii.AAC.1
MDVDVCPAHCKGVVTVDCSMAMFEQQQDAFQAEVPNDNSCQLQIIDGELAVWVFFGHQFCFDVQ